MEQKTHSARSAGDYLRVLGRCPSAVAEIRGSGEYPEIRGRAAFYQTSEGVLVSTLITGLPEDGAPCGGRVFAFHIHSGISCTGDGEDPFRDALTHYDPDGCAHPGHAGDLLPLFGSKGTAFSVFLTDRFTVEEVVGRVVILHQNPDDFTTQPSGNAGKKIACGPIRQTAVQRSPHSRGGDGE